MSTSKYIPPHKRYELSPLNPRAELLFSNDEKVARVRKLCQQIGIRYDNIY